MLDPYDLRQWVILDNARLIYEVRRGDHQEEVASFEGGIEGVIGGIWQCAYEDRLYGMPRWEWLWRRGLPLEPSPETVARIVAHLGASEPLSADRISLN